MQLGEDNQESVQKSMAKQSRSPCGSPPITESLTFILTTSPTPSAPNTDLLDSIFASFHDHCPALFDCRVIVVFDTYDKVAPANRLKKGYVTAEGAENFPLYKRNVQKLVLREFANINEDEDVLFTEEPAQAEFGSPMTPGNPNSAAYTIRRTTDRRVTFIEPQERLGFGLAVRSALRATETPYVWVQQHDWRLDARIPVEAIVEVMSKAEAEAVPVKYVCLPSVRMLAYADSPHVTDFPALRQLTATLRRDFETDSHTIPLTPLFFWHDKTHIALTEHYLNRVFPSRLAMPRGAFIEDHIGQRARNQMKEGNWEKWACWLYCPGDGKELCLRHLHGRTWRGIEAEKKKVEAWRLENGVC